MSYYGMALAFASIGFVAANSVLSLVVLLGWRARGSRFRRARPLFLLRMLPGLGSAAVVFGLVLPAFLAFEPRQTTERLGPALLFLVVLAAMPAALGLCRFARSSVVTRRLVRDFMAGAVRVTHPGLPVPVYRVPSGLPLAALVGVVRPRLFVSDRLLGSLSASELRAVMCHETAHLAARDNLKRTLLRLAPDWLCFSATGREIEAAWAVAAEEQADDRAAGPAGACSLDLASSLLKAARMVPAGTGRLLPASNFCDGATVARRVERLLSSPPASAIGAARAPRLALARVATILCAAALLARPALQTAYALIEAAVRLLQ